jgi:hypothetical protein
MGSLYVGSWSWNTLPEEPFLIRCFEDQDGRWRVNGGDSGATFPRVERFCSLCLVGNLKMNTVLLAFPFPGSVSVPYSVSFASVGG